MSYNKHLQLSVNSIDVVFDIDLKYKKSFVIGDSGTGKSLFCEVLKMLKTNAELNSEKSDVLDMILLNYTTTNFDLSQYKNKLIVIDNWDLLCTLNSTLSSDVYLNTDNAFLIFGRNCDDLHLSMHQIGRFKRDGNRIYLKYLK